MTSTTGPRCSADGCSACDALREREGNRRLIGKPCDICNGTGSSYLGGGCRHREPPSDMRCSSCARALGACMADPCPSRKALPRWAGGQDE